MLWKNEKLAAWLEASLHELFADGRKVSSACIVAQMEDGNCMTGYYEADSLQKAIFAHNINGDAMLDVVLSNIDIVRDALDDLEDEEAGAVNEPDE